MRSPCTTRQLTPYAAGRIAPGDDRVFRPGGLELTARAIAFANLRPGAVVLDLGCGSGASVRYLRDRGFDAIGIDCEGAGVRSAECSAGPHTHIAASADELPFPDGAADGILAECSISLMQDRDRVLSECARVLADGGRMTISDLYAREPAAIAQVRALKRSGVSGMIVREELERQLVRNGFTIDLWEDHSRALRECAARYIIEYGSVDGLWGCGGEDSAAAIQCAMRAARAGYFLLVATRRRQSLKEGD